MANLLPKTASETPAEPRTPADSPDGRRRPNDHAPGLRAAASRRAGPKPTAALVDVEPEITGRLRAQYAEISQLAGGLAHEIRNPLSTLSLNLDLLAEDFQNPRPRRGTARRCSASSGCGTRFAGSTTSSRTSSDSPGFKTWSWSRPT